MDNSNSCSIETFSDKICSHIELAESILFIKLMTFPISSKRSSKRYDFNATKINQNFGKTYKFYMFKSLRMVENLNPFLITKKIDNSIVRIEIYILRIEIGLKVFKISWKLF